MASLDHYNSADDENDYDELDNSQRLNASSRYNPADYNYFNSGNSNRDLTLNLPKTTTNSFKSYQPIYDSPESDSESLQKYLSVSVSLVSLITENLLSHPFIVLRRQCQVHHNSRRYHLVPITLAPVIVHLHRRQGVTTLFKGIGSSLLVRGMSLAVEDVLSKFTPWPKEINSRTTVKQFTHHLILKSVSLAIVMPFYAASLVETVQSDIASEKPGILDVFKEGSARLFAWSSPAKGRMLPCWALLGPSVGFGLCKYLVSVIVKGISTRIISKQIHRREEKKGARSRDLTTINNEIELYSNIISLIMAESLFFPFETILHRIQLQGTRTIIDNLDSGIQVVPILTNYEGAIDCWRTTISSEGFGGLYKGFGAMILQFAAHIAVIKLSKWIINQISEICADKAPPKVADFYNLDPATSISMSHQQGTATVSRSLSYVSSLNDEP